MWAGVRSTRQLACLRVCVCVGLSVVLRHGLRFPCFLACACSFVSVWQVGPVLETLETHVEKLTASLVRAVDLYLYRWGHPPPPPLPQHDNHAAPPQCTVLHTPPRCVCGSVVLTDLWVCLVCWCAEVVWGG